MKPATPAAPMAPAAPSTLHSDIERAFQVLERADPKQLGDASEEILRGFLDKVVKVLAGKEIEKVAR